MAIIARMQNSRIATNVIKRDLSWFFRREMSQNYFVDFADNRWTADETNSFNRYYSLLYVGS